MPGTHHAIEHRHRDARFGALSSPIARMLGAAHALEQAFASNPELARPQPDMLKLQTPSVDLKSIVTDPPQMSLGGQASSAQNAV